MMTHTWPLLTQQTSTGAHPQPQTCMRLHTHAHAHVPKPACACTHMPSPAPTPSRHMHAQTRAHTHTFATHINCTWLAVGGLQRTHPHPCPHTRNPTQHVLLAARRLGTYPPSSPTPKKAHAARQVSGWLCARPCPRKHTQRDR